MYGFRHLEIINHPLLLQFDRSVLPPCHHYLL